MEALKNFFSYLLALITENWHEKLFAVFLALVIWKILTVQQLVTVVKPAAVLYKGLDNNQVITSELLRQVSVTLKVNRRDIENLADLQILVDMSLLPLGKSLVLFRNDDLLGAQPSAVQSIEPKNFEVELERAGLKSLTVRPHFIKAASDDPKAFSKVHVSPAKVLVKAPLKIIEKLDFITTAPISLRTVQDARKLNVGLQLPANAMVEDLPGNSVTVIYSP